MDRIARARHQHHVARRGDRLRHVGEAFLGAERDDHLALRIELHAEAAAVIGGLRAAQPGDAARGGIAVGARLADGLHQLLEDMRRRRQVGIAHAEVDDVGAAGAGRRLQPVDLLEDVGRQPPYPVKSSIVPATCSSSPRPRKPLSGRCPKGETSIAAPARVPERSGQPPQARSRARLQRRDLTRVGGRGPALRDQRQLRLDRLDLLHAERLLARASRSSARLEDSG